MFEEISRAVIEGNDEGSIKLTQKYLDPKIRLKQLKQLSH